MRRTFMINPQRKIWKQRVEKATRKTTNLEETPRRTQRETYLTAKQTA
jgi:hypothetical protein